MGTSFLVRLAPKATDHYVGGLSLIYRDMVKINVAALQELGFERVHVCDAAHDVGWLTLESARLAMTQAEVEPPEIDVVIWAKAEMNSLGFSRKLSTQPEHALQRLARLTVSKPLKCSPKSVAGMNRSESMCKVSRSR